MFRFLIKFCTQTGKYFLLLLQKNIAIEKVQLRYEMFRKSKIDFSLASPKAVNYCAADIPN